MLWSRWLLLGLTTWAAACAAPEGLPADVPTATLSAVVVATPLDSSERTAAGSAFPAPQDQRQDETAHEASPPVRKGDSPPTSSIDLTPREIVRGSEQSLFVALTFDCGTSSRPTPQILETLKAAGIAATFFVTGQWVEKNPDLLKAIAAEHQVANHTVSHRDLTRLSAEEITAELLGAENRVRELTGKTTQPFFRAPFGSRNERVLRAAAQAGFPLHVYWTVDSADWRGGTTAEGVYQRTVRLAQPGAIIVFHCGSEATAAALPQIIAALKERGLALVTVSQLLSAADR